MGGKLLRFLKLGEPFLSIYVSDSLTLHRRQCFLLPSSICKKLDTVNRDFFGASRKTVVDISIRRCGTRMQTEA